MGISPLDERIWRMKLDGVREDSIDIKLECSPKQVREALAKPNPFVSQSVKMGGLESWQLPEMEAKRPDRSVENRMIREWPDRERSVNAPAWRPQTVTQKVAVVAKSLKPAPATAPIVKPVARAKRDPLPKPAPATKPIDQVKVVDPRITIEACITEVCDIFSTSKRELKSKEPNMRNEGHRNAIYLTLLGLDIVPTTAAQFLERTEQEASAEYVAAMEKFRDKQSGTRYFTKLLCIGMQVDFKKLEKKII